MIMKLCLRQNKNEDHCLGSGLFLSKISWKCPSDFDIFLCMLSLYWECLEKDKGARILKDKKQGQDILSGKTILFEKELKMEARESLIIEL